MEHLSSQFAASAARFSERIATRVKRQGEWLTQTFAELDAAIERVARGLVQAGIGHGDRVGLFATNTPQWTEVDFACQRVGAVTVPIYPSSTPGQARHILASSAAKLLFVDSDQELARIAEIWPELESLEKIIVFQGCPSRMDRVVAYQDFYCDDEQAGLEVKRRSDQLGPEDLLTIIYTSGTTGEPKGVMLQHKAVLAELRSLELMIKITPEDHSVCFLPLSHAFERAWTFYVLLHGCTNTYCADPHQLPTTLVEIKPTLLVNVPRFYDLVVKTAREKVADSKIKKGIFSWAMHVGGRAQRKFRKGKRPSMLLALQLKLADHLVLKNIRDAVGGPKTVLACGGAPLRQTTEEFFSAAGLQILPGYGMTEAAPLISFNAPGAFKIGTAGRVMAQGEVRIGADAEILYRGPNLMQGYWHDEVATQATIDEEGWLHTGDAGYVDNQGFLVITDRIKDLLVTSGGKNVAPQPIEGTLLVDPLFEHAVLLGNDRPFLTLLVKPSLPHLEELGRDLQLRWENRDELLGNPQIIDELKRRVATLTAKLPKHEQIKDLRILKDEFTTENGLLTPTLKVKRQEVEKRFGEIIEEMYQKLSELRSGNREK